MKLYTLVSLVVLQVATAEGCQSTADAPVPETSAEVGAAPVPAPAPQAAPPASDPVLTPGRYGCTASRYNSGSGMYEYDPKGTVVLHEGGEYEYLGFDAPSRGRYRFDDGIGKATFSGGYLEGGEATPMENRPGRFYLTAPAIGTRWTCGLADGE